MKRRNLLGLALGAGVAAPFTAPGQVARRQAPSSVDIGSDPQIFVDDFLIDRTENVMRTLNQPTKSRQNPLVRPDRPWEGYLALQPGSVIYDESDRLFKMWYNAQPTNAKLDIEQYICYATSRDGVNWEKPALNLVEHQGSSANNIVLKDCYWTLSVVKDDADRDASRRYKLAYWRHGKVKCGVSVAFSPDGIRWTDYPGNPVVPCSASGDTFSVMQDTASRQFFLYHKTSIRPLRKVSRMVSDDFIHWRDSRQVLEQDAQDQPDTEFYGLSAFPYGGQYVGMLWIFHQYTQFMDVQLASSRDGLKWERAANRRIFLPLGFMILNYGKQAFDSGMIYPASAPARKGDTLWIYYSGFNHGHNRMEREHVGAVGGATLRLDGFCSLDATSEGFVTTRPLRFRGSSLNVNAQAFSLEQEGKLDPGWEELFGKLSGGKGRVRVEVQDERGVPVPGYELANCTPAAGDGTAQPVSWKGRDLSALRSRAVRFKFAVANAKLYSFTIA